MTASLATAVEEIDEALGRLVVADVHPLTVADIDKVCATLKSARTRVAEEAKS